MSLQDVLDAFGNPMGKLYDRRTGDIAFVCGQDAGEVRYVIIRWLYVPQRWKASKSSQPLPAGDWRPVVGETEESLKDLAQTRYEASA